MTCITSPMSRDEVSALPISLRTASSSTVRCSSRSRSLPRIFESVCRLFAARQIPAPCVTPPGRMKLILCSASPRRRAFLERLGIAFEQAPAHIDETQRVGEAPLTYVLRMAVEKAKAAARPETVPLAADTIVVVGGEVLGKPRD